MTTTTLDTTSYASSTENKFQMFSIMLCGIPLRMIVTNPENIMHCRSTWYCVKDLGDGVGATNSRNFLDLLRNKEEDSRIFSQSEVKSANDPSDKSIETILLARCKDFQNPSAEENSEIPLRGLLLVSRIEIPKIPKGSGKLTAFQSLFMGGRFALLWFHTKKDAPEIGLVRPCHQRLYKFRR